MMIESKNITTITRVNHVAGDLRELNVDPRGNVYAVSVTRNSMFGSRFCLQGDGRSATSATTSTTISSANATEQPRHAADPNEVAS
jgi:hypothetical protein